MSHNRDLSAAAAQIGFHSSNIGIGTDAPSETITLNHANGASIGLEYGGSEHGSLNVNSAAMYARAGSGKHLILGGNATESLRLKSDGAAYFSGNLGLGGQTSPGAPIHLHNFGNDGYELKITGNAVQFNRSSNSYIDQLHNSGSILFRMTSSHTEAMRITSAGNLGIGDASPTKPLTVGTTTPVILLDDQSSRTLEIRGPSTTHIASILTTSGHALLLGTNNSERLRIDANGTLLVNAAIDNTGGHGQIVAHAPTTGNTIYKAIEIGNTDGNGTARGAAIVGQPQSNSHLPYTLIGSWDHGDNTDVYYGGGWGGAMRPATRHRFYTNSSYPTTGSSGTEVIRITENGDLGVNILDPQEKLHVHILKNSGSTSTTRTKQHAAMRLSLQRNGGSAPYYGWGPALDFYSDNYDGSTRRPNARIAGVISNSSVDHEGGQLRFYTTANDTATSETDFTERMRIYADGIVTKPYQPAFMAKLSTATGQNFNGTLIFNSVNHNIGGHYNSSNGRFTAPVAATYLFNWYTNVDTNSNSTSLWGDWLINGSYTNYRFYTYVNHTGWELLTASIIFNLSANDYVNVYVSTSGNYDGGSYGSFNGCLLG